MLKMFNRHLMASVAFDTANEGGSGGAVKTDIQKQREAISVETTNDTVKAAEGEKTEGESDGGEGEGEGEGEAEGGEGETEGDGEVEGEDEGTKEATADDPEKLKKTIARLQKRIDKKTGSESELRKQLREANEALQALKKAEPNKLSPEDVKKEAERIAAETLTQKEFDAACNRLADAAEKTDKNFDAKVKVLNEEVGPIPGHMIAMLDELDNGGAILAHLTNELEEAEKLWSMPPNKQAIALVKLSEKIKPSPKKVSQTPPPNRPLDGTRRTGAIQLTDNMSDKEWIEKRQQQVLEKRKSGQRPNLY